MKYLANVLGLILCATFAHANDITVYAVGVPNVVGNSTTSAPGFATGFWQAAAMAPGDKSEVYIPTSLLFSSAVHVNDIASISYWTNKSGSASDPDWTFYIYTALETSGNTGSFYNTRLNSEPYLTGTASVTSNTWHEWSTSDATNPMRFYDANRDGGVYGTFTDPKLSDLQAGTITWPTSGTMIDYGNKVVSTFSFQTGSGWANGFDGKLDGFTVTLKNGDVGTVNFEPDASGVTGTPLPSAALGGVTLLGMVGLGSRRGRRLASVQEN